MPNNSEIESMSAQTLEHRYQEMQAFTSSLDRQWQQSLLLQEKP